MTRHFKEPSPSTRIAEVTESGMSLESPRAGVNFHDRKSYFASQENAASYYMEAGWLETVVK